MRHVQKKRSFPGADFEASERMTIEVENDERSMIAGIRQLREIEGVGLEALAFVLGTQSAQLSRHLNGKCGTYLSSYLRIARALGFRCEIRFTKVAQDPCTTTALKTSSTKMLRQKPSGPKAWTAKAEGSKST